MKQLEAEEGAGKLAQRNREGRRKLTDVYCCKEPWERA